MNNHPLAHGALPVDRQSRRTDSRVDADANAAASEPAVAPCTVQSGAQNSAANTDQADHLGRLLIELSRDYQRRALAHCRSRGHSRIRNSHAGVVFALGAGRQRLTDLAERGGMTQQAMGKLVKELERIGYVSRCVDPRDRRAKIIELTQRGHQLLADNGQIMTQLQNEYAQLLGDQHLQNLEEALRYARAQLSGD